MASTGNYLLDYLNTRDVEAAADRASIDSVRQHNQWMDELDRQQRMEAFNRQMDLASTQSNAYTGLFRDLLSGPIGGTGSLGIPGLEDRIVRSLDDPDSFKETGAYKWRLAQGQKALERSKLMQGLGLSGNLGTSLADYGQNAAQQGIEHYQGYLRDLLGGARQERASMYGSLAGSLGQFASGLGNIGSGLSGWTGSTGNAWNAWGNTMAGSQRSNVERAKNMLSPRLAEIQGASNVEAARAAAQGQIGAAREASTAAMAPKYNYNYSYS